MLGEQTSGVKIRSLRTRPRNSEIWDGEDGEEGDGFSFLD